MPVKKDADGRRYVQADAEVPGTPEDVWEAIATGPGISSWFVPSEVEGREGGEVVAHFGPGSSMDSVAKITAWDPPRRFVAEGADMGPNSPTFATEWVVEARAGGTCVVRVVHSWFSETDDWDNQFEGTEHGWAAFFRILRLRLAHFRGLPCAAFQLMGVGPAPASKAWDALTGALGIAGAAAEQRVRTSAGVPPLAGVVERVGPSDHPELLIRLDEPAPGIAHLFALPMGGQIFVSIRVFLYGDRAPEAVARDEPLWQAWLNDHFPMAPPAAACQAE